MIHDEHRAVISARPASRWIERGLVSGVTLLLGYFTLIGGTINGGMFRWQWVNLVLGTALLGGWWLWRGIVRRAGWPRTELEWPVVAAGLLVGLSLIASPDRRVSLIRVCDLLLLTSLFYALMDSLWAGLDRHVLTRSLLVVTGVLQLLALQEVYSYYSDLWAHSTSLAEVVTGPLYRLTSFVGHANLFAAICNLAFPLVWLEWRHTRNVMARGWLLLWAACYLISMVFASSRGGILAATVMATLLVGAWLWERNGGSWLQTRAYLRAHGWKWGLGLALLLLVTGLFVASQAAQPTHGGLLASRTDIWQTAMQVIALHPWLGTGPGRYGFEVGRFVSLPPAFWPAHPHNLVLTVVAEYGWLGLPILFWLVVSLAWAAWQGWRTGDVVRREWQYLTGLGLLGFALQNLTDDSTPLIAVTLPLVIVLALFSSALSPRRGRWPVALLILPLGLVAVLQAQWLWGYAAFQQALTAWARDDKQTSLKHVQEAIRRDPNFVFYQVEAGLLASRIAADSRQTADWRTSAEYFETAVEREPQMAFLHANLGAALWQAGEHSAGLSAMTAGAQLAPDSATINFTAGWMAEAQGQPDEAQHDYLAALSARPDWLNRQFWRTSPVRAASLTAYHGPLPNSDDFTTRAERALAARDLSTMSALVAEGWQNNLEWQLPLRVMESELALADGREADAGEATRQALSILEYQSVGGRGELFYLHGWNLYRREPLPLDAAPDLLSLEATDSVWRGIEQWAERLRRQGDCTEAIRVDRQLLVLNPEDAAAQARLADPCP